MRFDRVGKCRCEGGLGDDGWIICNSCATLAFRLFRYYSGLSEGSMVRLVSVDGDVSKEVSVLRQLEFEFS